MTTLKVGGRELALAFTLDAMAEMQEAFGQKAIMTEKGLSEVLNSAKDTLKLTAILANQGEELRGKPADITAKWLGQHMKPARTAALQKTIMDAIMAGMNMETAEDDPAEEVDVVLEEMKKKDSEA